MRLRNFSLVVFHTNTDFNQPHGTQNQNANSLSFHSFSYSHTHSHSLTRSLTLSLSPLEPGRSVLFCVCVRDFKVMSDTIASSRKRPRTSSCSPATKRKTTPKRFHPNSGDTQRTQLPLMPQVERPTSISSHLHLPPPPPSTIVPVPSPSPHSLASAPVSSPTPSVSSVSTIQGAAASLARWNTDASHASSGCPFFDPSLALRSDGTLRVSSCQGQCQKNNRTCINKVIGGVLSGQLSRPVIADYLDGYWTRQQGAVRDILKLQLRLADQSDLLVQTTYRLEEALGGVKCGECCGILTNDDITPSEPVVLMNRTDTHGRHVEFPLSRSRGRTRCVECKVPIHHDVQCSVIRDASLPLQRWCRTCHARATFREGEPANMRPFFPQRVHAPTAHQRRQWLLDQQDSSERLAIPSGLLPSPETSRPYFPLGAWDRSTKY